MRQFWHAWWVAGRIVGLALRARLEYRAEFLLNVAVGAVWQTSVLVFATVLISRFSGLGGWPSDAVLLMVAVRLLGHALYVLVFERIHKLAFILQEGLLDGYLLRPMPVYRQIQLAHFPTNAVGDLAVGLSLFVGALWHVQLDWTWPKALLLGAAVSGGMLMEAAIGTVISSAALRFPASFYWYTWVEELTATFGNYPLKILPGFVSGLFTFVLPVAFCAYLPVAVVSGNTEGIGVPVALAAASPLVGLAAFVLARMVWFRSLRSYSGWNG
ncbi:ABC-2 family transporter protein [Streptomyces griseus]|uniref:ABC transporter permease n=1 Tax=Streptomyces griseus TaxID=1911 RepID=UPI0038677D51|nr:ABC-2 family transporter protein [Streptomyces fimicarius]